MSDFAPISPFSYVGQVAAKSNSPSGDNTFALIFSTGDQVMSGLKAFAEEEHLAASHFTAIGAFKEVTLGYFDWEKRDL